MKRGDVTCLNCGAAFRRLETTSPHGIVGEYRCFVCGSVLEEFDGSAFVTYLFKIHPPSRACEIR